MSKTVPFQTIQVSVSTVSMSKTVLFQTIQFRISTHFSFIISIDRTQSGATTPGVMAMKGYFTFPEAPVLLELHYQIVSRHIQEARWGSLTLLQRSSRCILQPQPTGLIICINTVKWFEGDIFKRAKAPSFFTQPNAFKYCHLRWIILFSIIICL